jgi:hypothetical protein
VVFQRLRPIRWKRPFDVVADEVDALLAVVDLARQKASGMFGFERLL